MFNLRLNIDFSWNEKVSSLLAIIFLMLLSFLIAWLSLNAANKLADGAQDSAYYNIEKRPEMQDGKNPAMIKNNQSLPVSSESVK